MRVVILTDLPFVSRESAMLSRLEVGLAGEGVSVDVVTPEGASGEEAIETLYARIHTYPAQRVLRPLPDFRVGRLLALLSERDEHGVVPRPVDVLHVFGEGAWSLALRLARRLDCALALEVWRVGLVHRAIHLVAGFDAPDRTCLFSPDEAIGDALRKESPRCPVRTAPWGVHSPGAAPAPPIREGRDTPVVVFARGEDRSLCARAFEGLCRVAAHRPVMIVTDDVPAMRAGAWAIARAAGSLERLTVVPDLERQRELVTIGGVLALPEPRGEHRSLILDAMGAGMAILARSDPALSFLKPDITMRAIARGTPDEWSAALTELLDQPAGAHALGRKASEIVSADHKVSAWVAAVIDAYEQLTAPNPIPMPPVA